MTKKYLWDFNVTVTEKHGTIIDGQNKSFSETIPLSSGVLRTFSNI